MGGVIWRQILTVSIWMSLVMAFLIFFGQDLYELNYETKTQIADTLHDLPTEAALAKMTHFTIIYNTYAFLQLFNLINCRVIGAKDFNPFKNIFGGHQFVLCWLATACLQILIVQFGGFIF